MSNFRERIMDPKEFLCGIEVVSTRGTMSEKKGVQTRDLVRELIELPELEWLSITDNAGGNPQLRPMALGKPILYAHKDVIIHLSCKDYNRNGLESAAWELASEGFDNILALSGDYPVDGHRGLAKPVFDIDSIGLLTMLSDMNRGLGVKGRSSKQPSRRLKKTNFFLGCAATNIKIHENEVIPQYLKLAKKLEFGAHYIINQIGYDSRKHSELIAYLHRVIGKAEVPLIGNIYVLSGPVAKFFNADRIPGVVVSHELKEESLRQSQSPDKGKQFFKELAAKQVAIYRGLGYRGVYFGGIHKAQELAEILQMADSFSQEDWKTFAKEIRYSRSGEFFYYAEDPKTGLADPGRLNPQYEESLKHRKPTKNVNYHYHLNKFVHNLIFTPEKGLFKIAQKMYASAKDSRHGPKLLRPLEHLSKITLFDCRDCGDCSLPDIAFLCPESQCAKNQRNGPCGGTREGLCEVEDFECIWARAYDRLKYEGREQELLAHVPVVQDQGLRGTSSWGNALLQRDHSGKKAAAQKKSNSESSPPASISPIEEKQEQKMNHDKKRGEKVSA